ncbi:MAG TPA: tRNA lysidine(34) synthetase TilS [Candidatus Latescibacteria bacterium]|nr:tRNA lysidine(34) synthetase TilS [Candidatus Latescibacterota bacterium]
MELIDGVLDFITRFKMFAPGEKVVVAVSGGPDSVALLDILTVLKDRLEISLHVAHLDHGLRAEDSQRDAEFVRDLAAKYNLPATVAYRNVREFLKKHRFSLEEGARVVRYTFLKEVAEEVSAQKIATAHTLDDQAETILFRVLRGAGVQGLVGIPPVREGLFVRPLLKVTRREILDFLATRGLTFRHDRSNEDLRYIRNRIRHSLIPYLKQEYNPKIVMALDRMADILRAEDEFIEETAGQIFNSVMKNRDKRKIILDIKRILGYHISIKRRVLRKALYLLTEGVVPEFKDIERLVELKVSKSRLFQLGFQITAQKWDDLLILKRGNVPPFRRPVSIPGRTDLRELDAHLYVKILAQEGLLTGGLGSDPQVAFLDLNSIKGGIAVRSRCTGDVIQPLGMKGHTKKVKDLLIDRKIPRILRDEIPLLVDQEKVLWVVGVEINELCRVTLESKQVLKIQFERDGEIDHG